MFVCSLCRRWHASALVSLCSRQLSATRGRSFSSSSTPVLRTFRCNRFFSFGLLVLSPDLYSQFEAWYVIVLFAFFFIKTFLRFLMPFLSVHVSSTCVGSWVLWFLLLMSLSSVMLSEDGSCDASFFLYLVFLGHLVSSLLFAGFSFPVYLSSWTTYLGFPLASNVWEAGCVSSGGGARLLLVLSFLLSCKEVDGAVILWLVILCFFFLFWIITSQEVFSVFRMHVYLYCRKFFRHGKTLFCFSAKMANVMSRHVTSILYISSFAFGFSALFF